MSDRQTKAEEDEKTPVVVMITCAREPDYDDNATNANEEEF